MKFILLLATVCAVRAQNCDGMCGDNTACDSDGKCQSTCTSTPLSECCSISETPCTDNYYTKCVGKFDPFCENKAWDAQCINEAEAACDLSCDPMANAPVTKFDIMLWGYGAANLTGLTETIKGCGGATTLEEQDFYQRTASLYLLTLEDSKAISKSEVPAWTEAVEKCATDAWVSADANRSGRKSRGNGRGLQDSSGLNIDVNAQAGDAPSAMKATINPIPVQQLPTPPPNDWFQNLGLAEGKAAIETILPVGGAFLSPLLTSLFGTSGTSQSVWDSAKTVTLSNEIAKVENTVLQVKEQIEKVSLAIESIITLVENDFQSLSLSIFKTEVGTISDLWQVTQDALVVSQGQTVAIYHNQVMNAVDNLLVSGTEELFVRLTKLGSATVNLLSDLQTAASASNGANLLPYCASTSTIIAKYVSVQATLRVMAHMAYSPEITMSSTNLNAFKKKQDADILGVVATLSGNVHQFCLYLQGALPTANNSTESPFVKFQLVSGGNNFLGSRTPVDTAFQYSKQVPYATGPVPPASGEFPTYPISMLQALTHQPFDTSQTKEFGSIIWNFIPSAQDVSDLSRSFPLTVNFDLGEGNFNGFLGLDGQPQLNPNYVTYPKYAFNLLTGQFGSDSPNVVKAGGADTSPMSFAFGYYDDAIVIYLVPDGLPGTATSDALIWTGDNLPVELASNPTKSPAMMWTVTFECTGSTCPVEILFHDVVSTNIFWPIFIEAGSCTGWNWHAYSTSGTGTPFSYVDIVGSMSNNVIYLAECELFDDYKITNCDLGTWGYNGYGDTYANGHFSQLGSEDALLTSETTNLPEDYFSMQLSCEAYGSGRPEFCMTATFQCCNQGGECPTV